MATIAGVTKPLAEWADGSAVSYNTIWARINKRGWSPEAALGLTTHMGKPGRLRGAV